MLLNDTDCMITPLPQNSMTAKLASARSESEHTWIMGQQILRAYSQETTNPLSAPKVDAYLCFHAHFENSEKDGGSLYKDDYVENFSRDRLVTLQRKCEKIIHGSNGQEIDWNFEFTPSPNKSFYTAKDNRDLTCFPWATCEIKHQGHINTPEETFLFCQAANGAAVSLTLLANAAAAGVEEPLIHEIRPVIAFTFTGPIARVWVAYIWDIEDLCYKHVRALETNIKPVFTDIACRECVAYGKEVSQMLSIIYNFVSLSRDSISGR